MASGVHERHTPSSQAVDPQTQIHSPAPISQSHPQDQSQDQTKIIEDWQRRIRCLEEQLPQL